MFGEIELLNILSKHFCVLKKKELRHQVMLNIKLMRRPLII